MSRAKTLMHCAVIHYQVTSECGSETSIERAHEILVLIYHMVCLFVCEDSRRALARGLSKTYMWTTEVLTFDTSVSV